MTVMQVLTLACSLIASSALAVQNITIVDDSPSDSPVSVKGTLTFKGTGLSATPDCNINEHNQTVNNIIMSVVALDVTEATGEPHALRFERDHFFKPLFIGLATSDYMIETAP